MFASSMMDAFLQACGIEPALELEVESTGTVLPVRYCLRQPFAIVGRHPAAEVQLDADGVRPRHLYFQAIEGRIACINVSQISSFLNQDKEINSFCWLPIKDDVKIGSRRIKLLAYETECDVTQTLSDPLAPGSALDIFAPKITLELTNEEAPGTAKTWLIDRLLTLIGRTERCVIQLNHELISNVHCSLVLTTAGLWVVDLLGRGGILINEQPVRVGYLGVEDELRLGPYRLRLQQKPEPFIIPTDESAYRELTPVGEFEMMVMSQPDRPQPVRTYQTPWPDDGEQAQVLEELLDQFQNMQGPMFAQNQHILSRIIESFHQLRSEQKEEVRKMMQQLRSITKEVELVQQRKATGATEEKRPNAKPSATTPGTAAPEPAYVPVVDGSPTPVRLASSLLENSDSSVFRIRTKTGKLFEDGTSASPVPSADTSLHTISEVESKLISQRMVNEASKLSVQPRLQEEDIVNTNDPHRHGSVHFDADHPPIDQHKAAHLQLHNRIDFLQAEQSSIWQRLSTFLFGKSNW